MFIESTRLIVRTYRKNTNRPVRTIKTLLRYRPVSSSGVQCSRLIFDNIPKDMFEMFVIFQFKGHQKY